MAGPVCRKRNSADLENGDAWRSSSGESTLNEHQSVDADAILAFVHEYCERQQGSSFGDAVIPLMRDVLERHGFDNLNSLIAFCSEPDNLRPWLPSEPDRFLFSDALVHALFEVASNPRQAS